MQDGKLGLCAICIGGFASRRRYAFFFFYFVSFYLPFSTSVFEFLLASFFLASHLSEFFFFSGRSSGEWR